MHRNFKFLFILMTVFAVNISAQVYKDVKPGLKIICSEVPIAAGEKIIFTATLTPASNIATYNWSISFGIITKGQGTPVIEVETPSDYDGTITATLEIGGGVYFEPIGDSCTINTVVPPKAKLLEEFPHSTQGYMKMMLDATLFLELQNDPSATGYIYIFPKTPKEKVQIERIIRNQIKVRAFDSSRIIFVEGGKNSRSILQFWSVPAGAKPPIPLLKTDTKK